MNTPPNPAAFKERTNEFFKQAAQAASGWYDKDGKWLPDIQPHGTRERYWTCFALYSQGMAGLADAVIRGGPTRISHIGKDSVNSFDIFHTNIGCALLIAFRDKMAADVRKHLEDLVRDGFSFLPGNHQPDYQFHGYNDNMPSKATMGLILGGEMLGCDEAVEHGLWNLRQFRNMLVRRGINSEFNSPVYSPLSIHAIGEIHEHARNAEAKEIALGIEQRLWIDLAARFHPEIGVLSGPYARSYTASTLCHACSSSALLWFVLGDTARPSPLELFNKESGLVLHHAGDVPFNVAESCWYAGGNYHVPPKAMEFFASKKYPFRAIATAEAGDAGADVPAHPLRIETVLQKDYAIGTCSTQWLGGEQAMSYFVTHKKTPEVRTFRDVGVVYHKFTINDDVPGMIRRPAAPDGRPYSHSGEDDNLNSRCNLITLQSENSVMVLTSPHLNLGGQEPVDTGVPQLALPPIHRLNEMVIFPSHFGGADEVWIGARKIDGWSDEARHGEWIGCRRGQLLIAVRPMAYSRDFGSARITLEKINHYEVVRSTFFHGDPRSFSRSELRHFFGGFVAEHASIGEYPSLEAFLAELSGASFTDYHWMTRRARYRRPAGTARPTLEMEASWSSGSRVPRFATVNGLPVRSGDVVEIDGTQKSDFPFLNEPWVSVPSYFPWKELEVVWGPVKGVIHDRE